MYPYGKCICCEIWPNQVGRQTIFLTSFLQGTVKIQIVLIEETIDVSDVRLNEISNRYC